jgi:phenylacetate-CoA ligase
MDLSAILARRVFVPFFQRRWGLYDPKLDRALALSQYDSGDQILERQLDRFRDLARYAIASNPFYQGHLAGADPEALVTPEAVAELPLLTKDNLRDRSRDLLSHGYVRDEMFHKRTGGSTGVPVHLWWDEPAHAFKRAIVGRHDRWAGYQLGDRLAALWGDTDKSYPLRERVYQLLCARTLFVDTLRMDDKYLEAALKRIRRGRPEMLMGHAHSLHFFTRYVIESGADDLQFRGIISTAETLTPAEREVIEGRFGQIVFDRYGCEEVSLIASECEAHDGLHTSAEGLYVEVVGGDAKTPGRVVVTDLLNRGMPIIRYDIGDLATLAPGTCACGRGLPRLGRVFGRTSDILYAPDGRQISGISILDTFVIHIPGIRQAQIVQQRIDHLRLRIVRDGGGDEEIVRRVGASVEQIFGSEMRYDVEYVDRIEPTPRGKYQFTICEIDPPDQRLRS